MQVSAVYTEIPYIGSTIEQNNDFELRYNVFTSSDKNDKSETDIYSIINTWKIFCIKQLKIKDEEQQQHIDYSA